MTKGSRKTKARASQQPGATGAVEDFSVYHFAHAEDGIVKSGRMSKATSTWSSQVKQIESRPATATVAAAEATTEDDVAWYDRDPSELELYLDHSSDSDGEKEGEEGEDNASAAPPVGRRRRRRLLAVTPDGGTAYPLDLWFLVGDFVDPEDVATFARICHATHYVTHSARFWYRLYNRHYHKEPSLPRTLQPQSMERIHGLRDRVIRALYVMYPPFMHRLKTRSAFEQDPDALKGATCTLIWHQNIKSQWHFFFKFLLPHNTKFSCPLSLRSKQVSRRHILLQDADIHHNPESGYCVLQVVTPHYTPLPPSVMGQILVKTGLNLSHGLRHHRLRLSFSPQQYTPTHGAGTVTNTVTLDPVLNAYVLHWWDPKYPHQPA